MLIEEQKRPTRIAARRGHKGSPLTVPALKIKYGHKGIVVEDGDRDYVSSYNVFQLYVNTKPYTSYTLDNSHLLGPQGPKHTLSTINRQDGIDKTWEEKCLCVDQKYTYFCYMYDPKVRIVYTWQFKPRTVMAYRVGLSEPGPLDEIWPVGLEFIPLITPPFLKELRTRAAVLTLTSCHS